MSSLAIWAKNNNNDSACVGPTIEKLHFNYWYLDCGTNAAPCLDIGILLSSFESLSELMIWLPFKIENTDVSDLACGLKDASLLGAVFNDEYRVDSMKGKACYVHLISRSPSQDSTGFILYELDVNSDIKIRSFEGTGQRGTILSILVENLHDLSKASSNDCGKRCYFRFRIQASGMQDAFVFGRNYKWFDAIFRDTLTATKLMDFRVNQSRSLPKTLCETIDSCGGYLSIEALHFLLLTRDTTTVSSGEHVTMRRLEKSVWDCYLPIVNRKNAAVTDDIIAYHWKQKGDVSNPSGRRSGSFSEWDVFIVLKFIHKSIKNLTIYFMFAILLGIVSNSVSTSIGF
ncbi:hypothetical protein [Adlercreutzia sp. ZJ304]|uniref:hypothetical protein n=1 Tax=Adlercreutzia sp. ZJ304 TaxID=2709791 RepID=UPI0013EDFC3B|nr:hypothetical protein [Adlercreutzia sp. ZJ304]